MNVKKGALSKNLCLQAWEKAWEDAALGVANLVDAIRRIDNSEAIDLDLETHIWFLGVFGWGIRGKVPVVSSA